MGPSSSVPTLTTASVSNSTKIVDSLPLSGVSSCCVTSDLPSGGVINNNGEHQIESTASSVSASADIAHNTCPVPATHDEGFIDESDCDCDTRNFCEDGENRVPFQYCFSCAPFHPSNGRGPTLVGPQTSINNPCPQQQQPPVTLDQEDKVIYDMDLKSNQNHSTVKRKRQISSEETEDAVNSIIPKKRRDSSSNDENLDDSGFQEEEKVAKRNFICKIKL